VALFGNGGVDMTNAAVVEIDGSLKAGHAAHRECWAHGGWHHAER
jgi:hypothetical protein